MQAVQELAVIELHVEHPVKQALNVIKIIGTCTNIVWRKILAVAGCLTCSTLQIWSCSSTTIGRN